MHLIAQLASGAGAVALLTAPASSSPPPGQLAPVHGPYAPKIDPANFVGMVDNRYLPYKPGTRIHFEGVRGKTRQTDEARVLRRTGFCPCRTGGSSTCSSRASSARSSPRPSRSTTRRASARVAERVVKGHHEAFALVSVSAARR